MGHGGLDKLRFAETVPCPVPEPGEVLIEVGACGVNNTDINTRTGWYDPGIVSAVTEEFALVGGCRDAEVPRLHSPMSFPRIQGAAVVGRITSVGPGSDPVRLGERVIVDPSVRDAELPPARQRVEYLGIERDGGYAEYVAVPAKNALRIDSMLSDAELATFPCSYDTAEEMLARASVTEGSIVVVTGAAGGVGTALIQLAKRRGARVIAIAGHKKEGQLKDLGADDFVSREDGDLANRVQQIIGPEAVDVVVDVVGGLMFGELLRMLRRGGRLATAGAVGGPVTDLDLREVIYKDLDVRGVSSPTPEAFRQIVSLIEAGALQPLLERTFGLEELGLAQAELARRVHVGKLVVTP